MRKIIKLSLLIVFLPVVLFSYNSFGQEKKKKPQTIKRESERRKMHTRDSLLRTFNRSDTSINSLLQRIEQYTTTFNQVNNNLSEGLDTAEISEGMPSVVKRISRIDSLINTHKSSTLRYLFVLRDNLDRQQDLLEGWQSDMEDVSSKLIQNQSELIKFTRDTSLKTVPSDSVIRMTFFARRREVMRLFHKTDSFNRANLLKVNLLQDKITVAYTRILDETDHIDLKIKRFAIKAFAGESDYIWNTPAQSDDFNSALKSTLRLNRILFTYFIKNETTTHYIGLAFFVFMLTWIILVRRKAKRHNENPQIVFEQANYIHKNPVLAPLLVATAIVPYFYSHPPMVFLETLFLVSLIFTLVFIKKSFPGLTFNFLHVLFWLTIIYGASNLFIQIANIDRTIILVLSVVSVITAWVFLRNTTRSGGKCPPYTGLVLKVFICMQILSVLLNITGRFSLAKIIAVTSVFNLWFLVILFFVVQIIVQGLFLQFQVKKESSNIINWIDYTILQKKFRETLVVLAAVLWFFFLLQNLNIDDWVGDNLTDLLNQPRSVGGSSFTFGGFVIFIAVIWLSSLLSKIISYFFDISSQRVNDLTLAKKKNRTSALLIRIGVFSAGFLLAVAASGFPLEKLTIIISAFGVGIGFGLQNIVNNLVSGIILAFEKPINIGDIIEVGSRSGTMKEIGIRSSRILTGDGSEVIIPNGDLISQTVVNWTLSNTNRQVGLIINTAYGVDVDKVKDLLKGLLSNRDDIMTSPGPSVFINNVTDSAIEFKAFFWAADINATAELKSRVLADIYHAFKTEGIHMPSTQKDFYLHFPEGVPVINPGQEPGK